MSVHGDAVVLSDLNYRFVDFSARMKRIARTFLGITQSREKYRAIRPAQGAR
jgi:hypothetical protein